MISCQKRIVLLTMVCLFWVEIVLTQGENHHCNIHNLHECGPSETCEQQSINNSSGICKCSNGYKRRESDRLCVLINPTPSPQPVTSSPDPSSKPIHYDSSHIVLGVMIPLALIALALGVIYAAQRFQWVQKIRAIRQRRYDEVQFGQDDDDDPPLA